VREGVSQEERERDDVGNITYLLVLSFLKYSCIVDRQDFTM
jgi:hypothetical protein